MTYTDIPHFHFLLFPPMADHVPSNPVSSPNSGSRPLGSPPGFPTSDVETSMAAYTTLLDTSNLPRVMCDHSAAETLIHMGGSIGGIPTSTPSTLSSSIQTPDVVKDNDGVLASNLSKLILLLSTRIKVSHAVDRATLDADIDSIYLRLDLQ